MTTTTVEITMDWAEYYRQRENVHTCFVLGTITKAEATHALERQFLSPDHIDDLVGRWTGERGLAAIRTRFMHRNISLIDAAYELEQLSLSQEQAGRLLNDWEDYRTVASFTNT